MIGAIIGDIVGSVYEFDNIKTKDFPLFSENSRFTDDTVCTIAVVDILLHRKDPVKTMVVWCRKYPTVGYGDQFMRWFNMPWQEPYNSFGNGSAMRVSPAGWLATTLDEALAMSDSVTEITHNHPEGMKGARATVHAIFLARQHIHPQQIRAEIQKVYGYDLSQSVDEIRVDYEFDETCQGSVPQAITCALEAVDFEDAIRNAISIGGDSDTIGAIAGAVAEARFRVPRELEQEGCKFLPKEILDELRLLYGQLFGGKPLWAVYHGTITGWIKSYILKNKQVLHNLIIAMASCGIEISSPGGTEWRLAGYLILSDRFGFNYSIAEHFHKPELIEAMKPVFEYFELKWNELTSDKQIEMERCLREYVANKDSPIDSSQKCL